jgi:hypothetical protein
MNESSNYSLVREISNLKNWFTMFIFTLLNFPEGTLFNRLNPIRARTKNSLDELKSYYYCGHIFLMGREEK